MSFGFGFALPAYPLRGGAGNNPFNQDGATLDLSFIGTAGDLSGADTYTLNTDFITPEYQVAAQYAVWENGVGLAQKTFAQIVTFTRASTATYFNSAGTLTSAAINEARFDYDPATLLARGFLIEESRTNRILYSEDFGDASWVKAGGRVVVTTDQIAAPDGTVTADFLEANGGASGSRSISQTDTSSATGKSQSVFAKAGTATFLQILFGTDTAPWANFDLSTGTVGSTGTVTSATITPVGNGWYRCQVTTASTTATNATINIVSSSTAVRNESNTLSAGLYIWGAQLEAGAFPTSYIPTTTTALTRSADVASVNTLSPWFNATGSTIYAEWVRNAPVAASDFPRGVDFINTSTTDKISINHLNNQTSSTSQVLYPSGLSWPFTSISGLNPTLGVKTAIAFQVGSARYAVNGTLGGSDYALASIPTLDQVVLGSGKGFLSTSTLNGWLRRVTYYPRRLSNADLQGITV